jgi:ankyrin repeat protein
MSQDHHHLARHGDEAEQAEEEDEDEPFVYPGATEESPPVEETQPPVTQPSIVEHDPAQLEEIYSAAVSGDLPLLQDLFQSTISSNSGNTEAFVLANDASSRTGLTPLHGAASRGHLEVVKWREYYNLMIIPQR